MAGYVSLLAVAVVVGGSPAAAQPVVIGKRPGPIVIGAVKGPPGSAGNPIILGGRVTFAESSFEAARPRLPFPDPITGRRGIRGRPFTADELRAAAPERIIRRPGRLANGSAGLIDYVVGRSTPNGRPPNLADRSKPLAAYVAELNTVEAWLNSRGYTLRDGVLAGRPGQRVASDLGLRFRLKKRDLFPKEPSRNDETVIVPNIRIEAIPIPPLIRDRFGPVAAGYVQQRIATPLPATAGFRIDAPLAGQLGRPLATTALANLDRTRLVAAKLDGFKPQLQQLMSGCPAKACARTYGKDTALTTFGQYLVDDQKWFDHSYCSETFLGFCVETTNVYTSYRLTIAAYYGQAFVDFFLANYSTNPCGVIAMGGKATEILFFKDIATSGTGQITEAEGTPATSFFDGTMLFNLPADRKCLIDYSGSNWFGASMCVNFSTINSYTKQNGFLFENSAGLQSGMTIFGLDIPLINGDARIHWQQAQQQPDTPPAELTEASSSSTLPVIDNRQYYQGPTAIFAIGPIPLKISSGFDTNLTVGQPNPIFTRPPTVADVTGQGQVGMKIGAAAGANVQFDAAISAIVLSAGVSGKLGLMNADLSAQIVSTIDPMANRLTVQDGVGFTATTANGSLDAFVEVDLLVYSKRWSVEIVSFDGVTKTVPFTNDPPFVKFAVDPKTIQPAKCPQ
jgi:hypothetical protein